MILLVSIQDSGDGCSHAQEDKESMGHRGVRSRPLTCVMGISALGEFTRGPLGSRVCSDLHVMRDPRLRLKTLTEPQPPLLSNLSIDLWTTSEKLVAQCQRRYPIASNYHHVTGNV